MKELVEISAWLGDILFLASFILISNGKILGSGKAYNGLILSGTIFYGIYCTYKGLVENLYGYFAVLALNAAFATVSLRRILTKPKKNEHPVLFILGTVLVISIYLFLSNPSRYDVICWIGSAIFLSGHFLVSGELITGEGKEFNWMEIVGASCFLIFAIQEVSLQIITLEPILIFFAIIALKKNYQKELTHENDSHRDIHNIDDCNHRNLDSNQSSK